MTDLTSALYVGTVSHRRFRHHPDRFRHRTYHALIDLDELPRLDREVVGFAYRRRGLTTFHDVDHFGPSDLPSREKLRRWLAGRDVVMPAGPVRVLANLRVLGHVFNPVSWWFCHHPDGRVALIVAEVHNTFGESHPYLLDALEVDDNGTIRARADKAFHVSPFLPIEGVRYRFTFVVSSARVTVHMRVDDDHGRLLDATQDGRRRELTTGTVLATLLTHPLMTLRTVALIHLHAAKLWRRRVPFHRKPAPPDNGVGRIDRPLDPETSTRQERS